MVWYLPDPRGSNAKVRHSNPRSSWEVRNAAMGMPPEISVRLNPCSQ
jgi:hypothetical protein